MDRAKMKSVAAKACEQISIFLRVIAPPESGGLPEDKRTIQDIYDHLNTVYAEHLVEDGSLPPPADFPLAFMFTLRAGLRHFEQVADRSKPGFEQFLQHLFQLFHPHGQDVEHMELEFARRPFAKEDCVEVSTALFEAGANENLNDVRCACCTRTDVVLGITVNRGWLCENCGAVWYVSERVDSV